MCYYITIGVNVEIEVLNSLPKDSKQNIYFYLNNDKIIKSLMPQSKTIADITDGHCSCVFYRPPKKDVQQLTEKKIERLTKLYKKRGYSQNKINRMINQKRESLYKRFYGPESSAALSNILIRIANLTDSMYIFCHHYSGILQDNKLNISDNIINLSSSHLSIPIQEWLTKDQIFKITINENQGQ